MIRCIALDAHGVIFRPEGGNENLLFTFVEQNGGLRDRDAIRAVYQRASLGLVSPEEYWHQIGLDVSFEDRYMAQIGLMPGFTAFCASARKRNLPVWCLSNDVTRWATKLRTRHQIDPHLSGCLISGDVALRKPDPAIYRLFLERSGYAAADVLFVDDKAANVAAAQAVGLQAMQFTENPGYQAIAKQVWGAGAMDEK